MNQEHTMSRNEWQDFRASTRNENYWPGVREGGMAGNRRRRLRQRLLWRLSRQIPLDDVTLSSPLIALSALSLMGALLALVMGYQMVTLVLCSTVLASLICHFRRHVK